MQHQYNMVFFRNTACCRLALLDRKEGNLMLGVNDSVVEVYIESIAAQVADAYAEKQKNLVTDAMRLFIATKTYTLLANPESYLYLEAAPYVEDMLEAELSGDWESWMEV